MTVLRDPESWLPEYGLNQMECIQAAVTMARFVVLAEHDAGKSDQAIREIEGSFVYASMLACQPGALTETMAIDLSIAGMEKKAAKAKAARLGDPDYVLSVCDGSFISEHNPKFGLWKRPREFKGGQFRAGITTVNEPKFVKAILALGRSSN